jgi:hypothetical protein
MRGITRTVLRTCAGLAVAAGLVAGGAGVASAATVTPAANTTANNFGHGCNPWQREHWNLNGRNKVEAVYLGNTYTYKVTFKQFGSCLTGTLTDGYYLPNGTTGPIWGTINKNHVTFSFAYPSGSVQGIRTYTGTINRWGAVSGNWTQTGSQGGGGTFTLARHANFACPWWDRWNHNATCRVFP